MISSALRMLVYALSAGYAVAGSILFIMPFWSAANFAWQVSPFVAMTIGGWCLGNAWLALMITRQNWWPAALCPILYLGLFGLLEAGVLIAFREKVQLGSPLAWIYVATIGMTAVFAGAALLDGLGSRPVIARVGAPTGPVTAGLTVTFILLVGFLGCYGLFAPAGMPGLNGSIFPERLTMFSLRAFGAFYLALALAVVPLLYTRGLGNLLIHGFGAYGLIVFITMAAVSFIARFDFAARPTQFVYIGVYVLVGAVVGAYFLRHGTSVEIEPRRLAEGDDGHHAV
jgi:hypothetical protein